MGEEEDWTKTEDGTLRLPDPYPEIVCAEYPTDRTTYWSRLTYRQWPILVLSSAALTGDRFEAVGRTALSDGGVVVPPGTIEGTGLERETLDGSRRLRDGTWFVLYTRDEMRRGAPRSTYVMTFRQKGALDQVTVFLPTPT